MESRVDQSSLASTSTSSVSPQSEMDVASPSTHNEAKSTRTRKNKKPRIVLQGTADEILDRNAARSASPAFVEKLVARAGTHWNKFYSNHAKNPATNQFFKDRHWTDREWPQLAQLAEPVVPKEKGKAVLEVGCGTGAFIYPYSLRPCVIFLNDTDALDTSGCSNGIRKLATSHSTLRKSELPFSLLFSSLLFSFPVGPLAYRRSILQSGRAHQGRWNSHHPPEDTQTAVQSLQRARNSC